MQAALAYARGEGDAPRAYILRQHIDIYGAAAVMNRTYLGVGEIRRMTAATNIINAYRSRAQSENWAEWSAKNPALAEILGQLERGE
jgi:hypothetical protein